MDDDWQIGLSYFLYSLIRPILKFEDEKCSVYIALIIYGCKLLWTAGRPEVWSHQLEKATSSLLRTAANVQFRFIVSTAKVLKVII